MFDFVKDHTLERRLAMERNVMNGKALWNAKGGKTVQERNPAGRGQAAQRVFMTAGAISGALLLVANILLTHKAVLFILPP